MPLNDSVKRRFRSGSIPFLMVCSILFSCNGHTEKTEPAHETGVQHGAVYYAEGRFAGWPANHGMWIWDDEILVGFVEAAHREKTGHTYDQSTARDKYARSRDGGLTWSIEDAYERGQTGWRYNNVLPDDMAHSPTALSEGIDFAHPDLALTFLRATNHTGPSHFYYSYDRGNLWNGPFALPNMGTQGVATRTDYIVDGRHELTVFLTVAKSDDREGRVVCARTTDGGLSWERVSWVGPEPERFDIMPSSVRLSSSAILTVIRTRKGDGQDLLTSYLSQDNGETWERLKDPAADTGRGGSPPALVKLSDGRLALAHIHRSQYGSRVNVRFSSDNGRSWSDEIVLRSGDGANRDVGYPRMVERRDGKLVLTYYWNNSLQAGAQPYRYIVSTVFDPDMWKSSEAGERAPEINHVVVAAEEGRFLAWPANNGAWAWRGTEILVGYSETARLSSGVVTTSKVRF